ncbi:hypothetical protein LTR35_011213 [Friedmanniomyces endolithicus]|uniref:Uncharacterized protein n=1 Tax=Friedmanniomyces endolithicus TaxID=329885 RepID=A0AAN6FH51_9PEZI|nr:hypothetical protein LTR35_011213 [Friedmanniomyces endolithicus]KAK0287094.1 hypothetical protein LTS00_010132 [Friedmanniomyces endolithicus]KAK0317649.1 hypothetical protein LTR82_011418 [Friedmanniomyces endolithicus]KAK0994230.1 hypothetical protein LTR54_010905 [Friedmanniomyces endolithicus]
MSTLETLDGCVAAFDVKATVSDCPRTSPDDNNEASSAHATKVPRLRCGVKSNVEQPALVHSADVLTSEDGANSLSPVSSARSTAHTTQAPSPHRFLTGEQGQISPSKEAKAPSTLGRLVNQRPAEPFVSVPPSTTASQFVPTPRFSAGKQRYSPSRRPSPPKAAFVDALRAGRSDEIGDDAEDAPPESHAGSDDEMLDNEEAGAVLTTEGHGGGNHDLASSLPFSPKRRKLHGQVEENGHDAGLTPDQTTFELPQTPASHLRSTVPRFSHPSASIPSTAERQTVPHRPSFLRSSVAPPEPSEPLPEAFSPHRRGQKFVPGGMAATMQQWVVETGQAAVQSRRGHAYLRGEDYVFKVKVEIVEGDGPYLVRATTGDGEVVHVMLAAGHGDRAASVVVGSVVGLRAPTWAVECEGSVWKVGVDWKML